MDDIATIDPASSDADTEMLKMRGSVRALFDTKRPVAIVEDDRDDRAMIRRDLTFLFGEMPVLSFPDGDALTQYLRTAASVEARPWLILLDLHMAGITGLETLEFLHSQKELADIPVIVVSGTLNGQEVRDAFSRGARAFLPKPLSRRDFVRVLSSKDRP